MKHTKGVAAAFAAILVQSVVPAPASAWTRPAHMVTAAIAYEEIAARRPDLLAPLGLMLDAHPDRGPFEVAIDRTLGAERSRRMFLECARWPDDVRGTPNDQPSWHAALHPVYSEDAPSHEPPHAVPVGEAIEAFALNARTLKDPYATASAKAVALCWVLHLAGDIHQPLHAAQLVSAAFPKGDRGGGLSFVRDPVSNAPISLHWFWDDAVHRSGNVADVDSRARALMARYPRQSLAEAAKPATAGDFALWARDESYPLAASLAFSGAVKPSETRQAAPVVSETHWRKVSSVAEQRVTLAGYRIADLVIEALEETP